MNSTDDYSQNCKVEVVILTFEYTVHYPRVNVEVFRAFRGGGTR